MAKFFALYMAPVASIEAMMANSTPEEQKKGMDEWNSWMKKNKSSLADEGAPLGKTKRVMSDGVSDAKNDVTGYSIIEASSHEEAAKLLEDNPHLKLPGAYIDLLTVVDMPSP
jgi:hypothetical protein